VVERIDDRDDLVCWILSAALTKDGDVCAADVENASVREDADSVYGTGPQLTAAVSQLDQCALFVTQSLRPMGGGGCAHADAAIASTMAVVLAGRTSLPIVTAAAGSRAAARP
jgi:hypothetical protein